MSITPPRSTSAGPITPGDTVSVDSIGNGIMYNEATVIGPLGPYAHLRLPDGAVVFVSGNFVLRREPRK